MADYTGFENFTDKVDDYDNSISDITSDLNEMDKSLKDMLKDFMEKYDQEFGVNLTDLNFWKKKEITGAKTDGQEPTIDNLLDYLEKHLQVELGEEKNSDAYQNKLKDLKVLKEKMKLEKNETSSKLLASAKTTLENQAKTIEANKKILEETEKNIEELSKKQTELSSKRDSINDYINDIKTQLADPSCTPEQKVVLDEEFKKYQGMLGDITVELAPIDKYLATDPVAKLEAHKTREATFEEVFENNKATLSKMFGENFIDFSSIKNLSGHQNPENTQGAPTYNAPSAIVQSTTTQAVNSRPENVDSKALLNNFMNEENKSEAISKMGYGDLAYIANDLKFGDRLAFTTTLKAAIESTDGLTVEACKKLIENHADFKALEDEVKDFYKNYNSKTPAQIEAFENGTLLKLKYACLLYDTKALKFSPVKKVQRSLSKKSAHIDTLKALLTQYSDSVVTRTNTKTKTTNSFREVLGHHTVEIPEAFRANNDARAQRDQQNARNQQEEDLTL